MISREDTADVACLFLDISFLTAKAGLRKTKTVSGIALRDTYDFISINCWKIQRLKGLLRQENPKLRRCSKNFYEFVTTHNKKLSEG